MKKGTKHNKDTITLMSKVRKERKEKYGYLNSKETREKISLSVSGKKKNYIWGKPFKIGNKTWCSGKTGKNSPGGIASQRVMIEVEKLNKQGYNCIPIDCGVIPDAIAFKGRKVYAVEVEYGRPNYKKYEKNGYKNYFDGVIWLVRRKQ